MCFRLNLLALVFTLASSECAFCQAPVGTLPLTEEGDLASEMVAGIDRFLLRELEAAAVKRKETWQPDVSTLTAFKQWLQPQRARLSRCLGMRESRVAYESPELVASLSDGGLVATAENYSVFAIRWPVLADPSPTASALTSVYGEGLLLVPNGEVRANVVAIPHCDHTPEQICGLAPGVAAESQYARRLAEGGCRVVVPCLISRKRQKRNGRANLTNREYLHRSAFELGRHLLGYEVQKILAAVDWFEKVPGDRPTSIGVIGYGEGGYLALLAAAVDERIDATCISGAMGHEFNSWQQPLDRNVFGMLKDFGTAELCMMIQPRKLITELTEWPAVDVSEEGGAPAVMSTPDEAKVRAELDRVAALNARLANAGASSEGLSVVPGAPQHFCTAGLGLFLEAVTSQNAKVLATKGSVRTPNQKDRSAAIAVRQKRQVQELDRYNQALLHESPFVRRNFMADLDTSSVDAYSRTVESYRKKFREDVIGHCSQPLLPFNARSRRTWDTEQWVGHEVMLDVFDDVPAYGVLLLPKDLKPGEKRPVVVCQHGLEGRPTDTFLGDHRAYHDFAATLCERGFIVFAPQNPYIFKDRFRTLQRKANPLGKTLFSVMVPQHQQIVNWLKTQPFVDGDRIGFYGLSYGGKSAMRIPALVTDYCLSICSADFNEWVRKNASTRHNFSYVWTGEYEIFEWDLGSTFNYFEMASLICPRPFMVERGHFDGVGTDDWVAYEYAKVRNLYAAKLGIADRTEIEWFVGPHTINGDATFRFLHRHLNWPVPASD